MEKRTFLSRLGRLFVIRTRWEAWAVIWAISLGAVERGKHYLEIYPGALGWVFFALCTGVVFIAGGKLLDSVRPQPALASAVPRMGNGSPLRHHRGLKRSRPRPFHRVAGSELRRAPRTD